MKKLPEQLQNLFTKIVNDFPELIGDNLVGIYIYGSLAHGTFNEKSSDIDCIVVLNKSLNNSEFKRLDEWYQKNAQINFWVKRLEMTCLIKKDILTKNSKISIYHNDLFKRDLSDGNPIIWVNIQNDGIILYGPKPKTFVPKISKQVLRDALRLELNYLREGISERKREFFEVELSYQVYAVLTTCRILYTFKYGTTISKQQAAKWCAKNLPKNYRKIIAIALKNIHNSSKKPDPVLEKSIPDFIDFISEKIKLDIAK